MISNEKLNYVLYTQGYISVSLYLPATVASKMPVLIQTDPYLITDYRSNEESKVLVSFICSRRSYKRKLECIKKELNGDLHVSTSYEFSRFGNHRSQIELQKRQPGNWFDLEKLGTVDVYNPNRGILFQMMMDYTESQMCQMYANPDHRWITGVPIRCKIHLYGSDYILLSNDQYMKLVIKGISVCPAPHSKILKSCQYAIPSLNHSVMHQLIQASEEAELCV